MAKYPHMSPRESEIWSAFLQAGKLSAGTLYYDARVGHPIPPEPGQATWVSVVRSAVSRKRIDAVVRTPGMWILYEVKVRAGLAAVGQAISYEYLFSVAIAGDTPVTCAIVCDYAARDVYEICEHEGIGLFVSHAFPLPFRWLPPRGFTGLT